LKPEPSHDKRICLCCLFDDEGRRKYVSFIERTYDVDKRNYVWTEKRPTIEGTP